MPATSPNSMLFKIIHTKLEIQPNIFSLLIKKTFKLNLEQLESVESSIRFF